jgi:hypothetical protein
VKRIMFYLYSRIHKSNHPWMFFHLMGFFVLLTSALKHHRRGSHWMERRHIIASGKQLVYAVTEFSRKGNSYGTSN